MLKLLADLLNGSLKLKKKRSSVLLLLILITACDKQLKIDKKAEQEPEFALVDSESKTSYRVFHTDSHFMFSPTTLKELDTFLKNARASGEENIEFLIVSDEPVTVENQLKIKKHLNSMMYRRKFIKSRIMDRGVCVYKGAKKGVRIGVLHYKVSRPNCGLWTDYVGDTDTDKNIPKYGVSQAYNLEAMIGNSADFLEPREYPGMQSEAAVQALSAVGGGGGSGGSSSSSSSGSSSSSSSSGSTSSSS